MKIGIFDSGIGGMTVLHQAFLSLPKEEYLYYADVDHVPYGVKKKEDIIRYVDDAVKFMISKDVKAVVIACNTATSVAIEALRGKYSIPILGIEPAVKPAVEGCEGKRIMVIATPVTVREEKLKNLIARVDEDHLVDLLPLPRLVTFAERGEFNSPELGQYLKSEFSKYDLSDYSFLVLGCTHFNFFKDSYRRFFPKCVSIIDGSEGTIRHLEDVLRENDLLENNICSAEYYLSGRKVTDKASLERIEKLHQRLDEMLRV